MSRNPASKIIDKANKRSSANFGSGESFFLNCEFCGSNIRGEPQAVNLDGGLFRVCNSCARLGTPARIPRPAHSQRPSRAFQSYNSETPRSNGPHNLAPPKPPSFFSTEGEDMELRSDYSRVIKEARESLGLSQEDLGRKINEKPSVISHLETGSMKPSDPLARKLEHSLKVQLFLPEDDDSFREEQGSTA